MCVCACGSTLCACGGGECECVCACGGGECVCVCVGPLCVHVEGVSVSVCAYRSTLCACGGGGRICFENRSLRACRVKIIFGVVIRMYPVTNYNVMLATIA